MKKRVILLLVLLSLSLTACGDDSVITCWNCDMENNVKNNYCSFCGSELEMNTDVQEVQLVDNIKQETWVSCPVSISQVKFGAYFSNSTLTSKTLNVFVDNVSAHDIDTAKFMVSFLHDSKEQILQCFSIDSILSGGSSNISVAVGDYDFSKVDIFPMCVYYENGDVWGDETATLDKLLKYSLPFSFDNDDDYSGEQEESSGNYYFMQTEEGIVEVSREEYEASREEAGELWKEAYERSVSGIIEDGALVIYDDGNDESEDESLLLW